MKALLYKDILAMKKEIMMILCFLLLYSTLAVFSDGSTVYSIMGALCGVIGMLPVYTFTYDEKNRFNSFASATPLPRYVVVLSKYLLGILGLIPLLGSMALLTAVGRVPLSLPLTLLLLCGTLIFSFIQVPLHFLLGASKARLITMAMFFLVYFGVFTLSNYLPVQFSSLDTKQLSVLALPAAAVVFVISAFLSYRIYLRKEY